MNTLQVEILNPKAEKLLHDLADLNLISIRDDRADNFFKVGETIRKKAGKKVPSLKEITREVEIVRAERYAKQK